VRLSNNVDASMENRRSSRIVVLDGPSVLSRPLLDNLQDNAGALPLGQGMLRMCVQESMDNGISSRRAWGSRI